MDLRNAGNGVDGKNLTQADIGICLFPSLSFSGVFNGLPDLHEPGGERPESLTRINRAPAKQDFVTFCRN
ncbi:hypothetical protein MGWOODY_Hyp820 [hydrothermal vent metagenome]|uniref:Uncharacterized protein n=1 Tax=hydrothermal vent metagenome TaxID=652676 RepID=A0A160U1Z9_9ZZZZ